MNTTMGNKFQEVRFILSKTNVRVHPRPRETDRKRSEETIHEIQIDSFGQSTDVECMH